MANRQYKPCTLSLRPEDVDTLDRAAREWAAEQGISAVHARSAFVRYLVRRWLERRRR